jgi:cap2 methyltransferase
MEDIIIELPSIEKEVKIKLQKKKGTYGIIDLYDKKISEEVYDSYLKAKNMEPFGEYKHPYWDFLLLSDNYFFGLGQYKRTHTNMYAQELYSIIYKFIETIFISKKFSNFNLSYYNIYKRFIKKKRNKNLFITNKPMVTSLEEYLFYSEYNNEYSYEEKNNLIFLRNHQTSDNKVNTTLDELKKLMIKKQEINYNEYDNNLCDLDMLSSFINDKINYKVDNIIIGASLFLWKNKKNKSYYSSLGIFTLILASIEKLVKNGNLIMGLSSLDSKISMDIITIIQIFFEKVYIIKPGTSRVISDGKFIIGKNFKGVDNIDFLNNLKTISREIFNYEERCGLNITGDPEKDKYYITSFLDYNKNIDYIKDFIKKEDEQKNRAFNEMINNYNYVKNEQEYSKESGIKAEKNLILQIFKRSLKYLRKNNIPIKVKYANIDREILDITNKVDMSYYSKEFRGNKEGENNFEKLYENENRLKIYKRKLDFIDEREYYNVSKIFTKPFKGLKEEISWRIGKNISQAFIKMYEILNLYNFFSEEKTITTFHCCEAPGQFILATKTYIEKYYPNSELNWGAQSLHPGEGYALGDDYGFIKNNVDRWDFGADKTGDISKLKNIKYYKKYFEKCDLVTFDCGFSFNTNFKATYQDKIMAELNFAAGLMILNGLKIGGNFVIKVFLPQSLPGIICLNYIFVKYFRKVYVYKSFQNTNSSEVYIIGKKYKGIDQELLDKMFKVYKSRKFDDFFVDIEDSFKKEYTDIMSFFIQKNINSLTSTVYYIENQREFKEEKNYIKEKQKQNNENWLRKFNMYRL